MFAHAVDAMPSYQVALAENPAPTMLADAGIRPLPTAGRSTVTTDWRVARVAGVNGLCFVRRGSGGWNGVVTVCEGKVLPLGEVQRPTLQPAAFHRARSNAASFVAAPAATRSPALSMAWQRSVAYVLLAIGLLLAMKSGSMLLQGSRKYG